MRVQWKGIQGVEGRRRVGRVLGRRLWLVDAGVYGYGSVAEGGDGCSEDGEGEEEEGDEGWGVHF